MSTRLEADTVTEELKPCPFCGEDPYAAVGDHLRGYAVACPHCDTRGPCNISEAEAVAAWNRRAAAALAGTAPGATGETP